MTPPVRFQARAWHRAAAVLEEARLSWQQNTIEFRAPVWENPDGAAAHASPVDTAIGTGMWDTDAHWYDLVGNLQIRLAIDVERLTLTGEEYERSEAAAEESVRAWGWQ